MRQTRCAQMLRDPASVQLRGPAAVVSRMLVLLDGVPYWLLALPLRAAVAVVFWNSAMAKLANWDTTIELFTDEYQVPLLPPELAAYMAATIELTAPVLLVVDDLHWADDATVGMLRALSRASRRGRILVIGAYRETDVDRRHPFAQALAIGLF